MAPSWTNSGGGHAVGEAGDRGVPGGRAGEIKRRGDRREAPGGGDRRRQIGAGRVGVAQRQPVDGDVVGADLRRRLIAGGSGDRDHLVVVEVDIEDVGVERIGGLGHDADPADQEAVLVDRHPARIGREAERRAVRPGIGGAGHGAGDGVEVGARELAELDAEQGPARSVGHAGIEMLLDDLAGGAARKRVSVRRQIGAGQRLGDRGLGRRHEPARQHRRVFEPGGDAAVRGDLGSRRRARHLGQRQHVADTVDDGDRRRLAARIGLVHRLQHDAVDIALGEVGRARGRRVRRVRGKRVGRAAAAAASARRRAPQRQHRDRRPEYGTRQEPS